jgi:hypothetical protein
MRAGNRPALLQKHQFGTLDAARGPSTPSLDHLVGGNEQFVGHSEAEHPGGRGVDNELELARLHVGHLGKNLSTGSPWGSCELSMEWALSPLD